MMKKTIKYAALLIVATLVAYGLFAFVLLQPNPAFWSKNDREFLVLVFIGAAIVFIPIVFGND